MNMTYQEFCAMLGAWPTSTQLLDRVIQGPSTLGLLDIMMVWANPLVFSKPPKLVKTDIMHINKPPPFFRS